MNRTVRAAISLPAEDFRMLESERKKLRKARSEVIRDALRTWFRQRRVAELERRYEEGYREIPEDVADVEALAVASLKGTKPERW